MSKINEFINKNASSAIRQRAKEIIERGLIRSMDYKPKQKMIQASVIGNWPYTVKIYLSNINSINTTCNCPYNYPGLCKHEVAVLLKYDEEKHDESFTTVKEQDDYIEFEDVFDDEQFPELEIPNYQNLTLAQVKNLVGTETYEEGRMYHGLVKIIDYKDDNEIEFAVTDYEYSYYGNKEYVTFTLENDELLVDCGCGFGGYCDHIAGVLIYTIEEQGSPHFFRMLEKNYRSEWKKEHAAKYGITDLKLIDKEIVLHSHEGKLCIRLSEEFNNIIPIEEGMRKDRKKLLEDPFHKLHNVVNFLPATITDEPEPDRGFGLIFNFIKGNPPNMLLKCCTARLNKKGDKLATHFNYENLDDFPDISDRERQILELATRYNRLVNGNRNMNALVYECHNLLTSLFDLLDEDSHVFFQHQNYWYDSDSKLRKSELSPRQFSGIPFDMEFDVYSDNKFVYLHLVMKIDEMRIRIDFDSKSRFFPDLFIAEYESKIYPAHNIATIAALLGYQNNPVHKMVKQHTEAFLDDFVLPLTESYHVNFDNLEGYHLQHNNPKPMTKKLYLSGMGQFVMFRPIVAYAEGKEINILKTGTKVTVDDKVITRMERDTEFESSFYDLIKSLHPKFTKQFPDEFFHLDVKDLIHDHWFFNAFDRLDRAGIEVMGINELHNFKYNTQRAKVISQISSGQDWFDVNVDISFGKEKVSLADVRKSILRNDKYIKLSDGSIGILPEEWVTKFTRMFRQGELKNGKLKISSRKFMIIEDLFGEIDDLKLIKDLNVKKKKLAEFTKLKSTKVPKEIKADLRDYQKEGLNWLNFLDEFGWGGILADDMGLGKTLQILTFLAQQKAKTTSLIVVPTTLMFNWENEIAKFCPTLKTHFHYGQNRTKDHKAFDDVNLVITTYGLIINDIEWLKEYPFHYVILDESQAIKNPQSLRFKAVGLLQAKTRITMTGTPIENNTFDLYAQMHFANPGLLGNAKSFKDNFSTPIDKDGDKDRAEELRKMINPFLIRRTKEQVATELPPKTEEIIYCHMEKGQQKVYDAFKNKYRDMLLGKIEEEGLEKSKIYVLEGLMKLRQICDSPRLLPGEEDYGSESVKIVELLRNIEEKTGKHKIVVFSQFVGMLSLIRAELEKDKINYEYLDGKSSRKQRKDSVDRFQDDEACRVFLISLKAGGTGLNLTAADYVFIVDPWWNPAVESQAIDRCYRIGQDKKVFAYRMICKDTIEEKIISYQNKKKTVADDIIQAEESFVKHLSLDDIKGLFA